MSFVMLKYRPIQYVEDPFRGEGRNIGVMVYGSGEGYFRCIGGQDGEKYDLSPFSRISRTARDNAWVFGEWAAWFKELSTGDMDRREGLQELLNRLEHDGAPFIAGREGIVEVQCDEPLDKAVDWLYRRLVKEPQIRNLDFQEALDNLLIRSEMMYRDGFERDIEIEFTPADAPPVRISANYALTGSPKAVFKVLRFKGAREHLIKRVNDVVYTFQQAATHGFASKEFCFVLTDKPTKQNEDLLAQITPHGLAINIMDSQAPKVIEAKLKGILPANPSYSAP